MNKSDLILKLKKENNGLDQVHIEKFVDSVLKEIKCALASGRRIEIRGFGAFSVRVREERIGRNPRTGEIVVVPQKKVPFFKMGRPLEALLNRKLH